MRGTWILFAGDICGARCVSAGSALIRQKKLKGRSKALQCLRLVERVTLGPQTLVSFLEEGSILKLHS